MAYWQDDTFDTWPEVYKAGTAAIGLYSRCGAYCARELTDGHIPAELAASYGTREWVQKLVEVGLWEIEATGYRDVYFLVGKKGNKLNPTREEALKRLKLAARRQALVRNPELREAVRARDGDRCRYCGIKVKWNDRKGSAGGTYDHVDPDGPNSIENLVVACRGCNSSKKDRTPEEAGMVLRPAPGAVSKYNPDEIQNLPGTNQVSLRPPSLPPSKEGKGSQALPSPVVEESADNPDWRRGKSFGTEPDPVEADRARRGAQAARAALSRLAVARQRPGPVEAALQRGTSLDPLDQMLAQVIPLRPEEVPDVEAG